MLLAYKFRGPGKGNEAKRLKMSKSRQKRKHFYDTSVFPSIDSQYLEGGGGYYFVLIIHSASHKEGRNVKIKIMYKIFWKDL